MDEVSTSVEFQAQGIDVTIMKNKQISCTNNVQSVVCGIGPNVSPKPLPVTFQ